MSDNAAVVVAETERLLLRRVAQDDFDDLLALFTDPDVMRYSPKGPLSGDETQAWLDRNLRSYSLWGLGMYAVVLRDDGFAGVCGINRFDDVEGRLEYEIGFRTAKRRWDRGVTTEAASACARPRLPRARHRTSRVAGQPRQRPIRPRRREGRHDVRQAGALPRHGPALLRHQPRIGWTPVAAGLKPASSCRTAGLPAYRGFWAGGGPTPLALCSPPHSRPGPAGRHS